MDQGSIWFHREDVAFLPRSRRALRSWLFSIVREHDATCGEINFVFCSDKYLLRINEEYLQHDTFTDIITFDYSDDHKISGDIFISIERVRENARKFEIPIADELHRVMAHGILHLLGFKDKTPAQLREMRSREDYCLSLRAFDTAR